MGSVGDINRQLNAAKGNFENGSQLSLQAEDQASAFEATLATMWDAVHTLHRIDLADPTGVLRATVAAARNVNLDGVNTLKATFDTQSTVGNDGLDPHIQKALASGDSARLHLTEGGETADMQIPIGLSEVEQRVTNIGNHLAALLEELRLARNQARVATIHMEKSTHGSYVAREEITAYQQENGLQ